jgi:hypothetical protein
MPRNTPAFLLLVLLSIGAAIASSGCTAIGFGAGALIDMNRGKGTASRLDGVRMYSRVTIWMRDGRKLDGIFAGREQSSAAAATTAQLASADSLAALPRTMILLGTDQGTQKIPENDVARVSVPVASGKVTGTLVGLGLDIVSVILASLAAAETFH